MAKLFFNQIGIAGGNVGHFVETVFGLPDGRFDVIDGAYTIEPLTDGRVLLHLSSHHRLSTRFNVYGGAWTDYVMRDLQNYILRIIKARCENQR